MERLQSLIASCQGDKNKDGDQHRLGSQKKDIVLAACVCDKIVKGIYEWQFNEDTNYLILSGFGTVLGLLKVDKFVMRSECIV